MGSQASGVKWGAHIVTSWGLAVAQIQGTLECEALYVAMAAVSLPFSTKGDWNSCRKSSGEG